MYEAFDDTVTKLPMQRMSADSDSDDSEDDSALDLVFDRSTTSSSASMEPLERLDALQRVNADLAKKLVDVERTLQRKLADHEVELEEMEARLEEAKSELGAAKREEKELRSKERSNQTQITALESEITKVQKTLDNSRTMYHSLQKQYQEQLSMC
jgi:chromosome segregation ATPase